LCNIIHTELSPINIKEVMLIFQNNQRIWGEKNEQNYIWYFRVRGKEWTKLYLILHQGFDPCNKIIFRGNFWRRKHMLSKTSSSSTPVFQSILMCIRISILFFLGQHISESAKVFYPDIVFHCRCPALDSKFMFVVILCSKDRVEFKVGLQPVFWVPSILSIKSINSI